MSSQPEDWSTWLPITTAVHNNRKNATTGLSPNQILLSYETTLIPSSFSETNNQTALERTERMTQSRAQAIKAINRAGRNATIPPSQFRVNDRVWLDAKNLHLPYQTTKLAPKCHGPFRITKEISPVAYQLSLPASWAIHDVFHTSLLLPYQENAVHGPNFSRPPPDLIQGAEEYEVEHLVNHRCHGRSRALQYFMKWKGYPESDNTWESLQDIHAPDLLKEYHQRYPLQDKKGGERKGKVSSRLCITALCRMPRTSLLPVSLTSSPSPLPHTTTRSPSLPSFPSMLLGKSSAKQRSAMRRNRSQSYHARDSMSSETANAPRVMQLRSQRDSWPPSRTGRVSTNSGSYSSRRRSPDSNARSNNSPTTTTNPTTTTPVSWQPRSGSPSMPATSRTSPSPVDETLANWPNGSKVSPRGEPYPTLGMRAPGTN